MFGYVGAEQKEGWFYVTDNKQPKIKIKILGNGERAHQEVHREGTLLGLRQGEDREGRRLRRLTLWLSSLQRSRGSFAAVFFFIPLPAPRSRSAARIRRGQQFPFQHFALPTLTNSSRKFAADFAIIIMFCDVV